MFPKLLTATHPYTPLSVLLTWFIVSDLKSDEKLILDVLLIWDPSLVQDNVGAGFATALQDKFNLFPSAIVTFRGWAVNSGWSAVLKQNEWAIFVCLYYWRLTGSRRSQVDPLATPRNVILGTLCMVISDHYREFTFTEKKRKRFVCESTKTKNNYAEKERGQHRLERLTRIANDCKPLVRK